MTGAVGRTGKAIWLRDKFEISPSLCDFESRPHLVSEASEGCQTLNVLMNLAADRAGRVLTRTWSPNPCASQTVLTEIIFRPHVRSVG